MSASAKVKGVSNADKRKIQQVVEFTNATAEQAWFELQNQKGDVQAAVSNLLDNPFTTVKSKQQKQKEKPKNTQYTSTTRDGNRRDERGPNSRGFASRKGGDSRDSRDSRPPFRREGGQRDGQRGPRVATQDGRQTRIARQDRGADANGRSKPGNNGLPQAAPQSSAPGTTTTTAAAVAPAPVAPATTSSSWANIAKTKTSPVVQPSAAPMEKKQTEQPKKTRTATNNKNAPQQAAPAQAEPASQGWVKGKPSTAVMEARSAAPAQPQAPSAAQQQQQSREEATNKKATTTPATTQVIMPASLSGSAMNESSDAGKLQLQFGQFGLNSKGSDEFGAGFGFPGDMTGSGTATTTAPTTTAATTTTAAAAVGGEMDVAGKVQASSSSSSSSAMPKQAAQANQQTKSKAHAENQKAEQSQNNPVAAAAAVAAAAGSIYGTGFGAQAQGTYPIESEALNMPGYYGTQLGVGLAGGVNVNMGGVNNLHQAQATSQMDKSAELGGFNKSAKQQQNGTTQQEASGSTSTSGSQTAQVNNNNNPQAQVQQQQAQAQQAQFAGHMPQAQAYPGMMNPVNVNAPPGMQYNMYHHAPQYAAAPYMTPTGAYYMHSPYSPYPQPAGAAFPGQPGSTSNFDQNRTSMYRNTGTAQSAAEQMKQYANYQMGNLGIAPTPYGNYNNQQQQQQQPGSQGSQTSQSQQPQAQQQSQEDKQSKQTMAYQTPQQRLMNSMNSMLKSQSQTQPELGTSQQQQQQQQPSAYNMGGSYGMQGAYGAQFNQYMGMPTNTNGQK